MYSPTSIIWTTVYSWDQAQKVESLDNQALTKGLYTPV